MAERITKVVLEADIAKYEQNMRQAAAATKQAADEGDRLAQAHRAMTQLGQAGMAMGAALGAGIGVAIAKFAEFDQAMSAVEASTHESSENMELLRDAAIDAGASTVFSATEAAGAIEELAKAGVSTADILNGGLNGALDLAAAGGMGVAEAAAVMSTTLQQFQMPGTKAAHVADLLAAGAGKAMGDVSDLGEAMKYVGPIANSMGIGVEEVTGALAMFAQQGILGSQAGTSLRAILSALTAPTARARKEMENLGLNLYDSTGAFIGIEAAAGQLAKTYGTMSEAERNASMGLVFGREAATAATILVQQGAAGVREWTTAVDDAGYAAETAEKRLDNLIGDWEALTGAMDTLFISMGEGADGPLRAVVQGLTDLVDGFNGLPDWAKNAALGVGVLTAGIGLVGGAALIAVPKIAELKIAMTTLAPQAAAARTALGRFATFMGGPWGVALTGATLGVTLLNKEIEKGIPTQEEIANKIATTTDAAEKLGAAVSKPLISPSFLPGIDDNARKLLEDLPSLLDQAAEAEENWFVGLMKSSTASDEAFAALERYGQALAETASTDILAAQEEFALLVHTWDLTEKQAMTLLDKVPALKASFVDAATEAGVAAEGAGFLAFILESLPNSTDLAGEGLDDLQSESDEAAEALQGVVSALDDIAGKAMGLADAKDAALSAINGMKQAAEDEEAAIDGTNDASIRLRDSVRDVEQSHRDSAQSIIENTGSLKDAQAEWQKGREEVLKMLEAKGLDRDEAIRWANQNLGSAEDVEGAIQDVYQAWLNLPENKETKYRVENAEALRKLEETRKKVESIPGFRRITLETITYGNRTASPIDNAEGGLYKGGVKEFASGGFEPGIYPYAAGGIHKFAEEYDEAYISMDPRRRRRSEAVWLRVGQEFGFMRPKQEPVAQGSAPLVGSLTLQSSGDVRSDLEEVNFHLRSISRGGRNGR